MLGHDVGNGRSRDQNRPIVPRCLEFASGNALYNALRFGGLLFYPRYLDDRFSAQQRRCCNVFFRLGVYFALRGLRDAGGSYRSWLLAGIFFGLAIGSKYNGLLLFAVFALSVLAVYGLSVGNARLPFLLHCIVALLLGSPFYKTGLAFVRGDIGAG